VLWRVDDIRDRAFLEVPERWSLAVEAALRCALIEQLSRSYPVPVLIDDPFTRFDAAQRSVLTKMLRYLGQVSQVLVLTAAGDVEGNLLSL